MDTFSQALELLPRKYEAMCRPYRDRGAEELRLRVGRPPSMLFGGEEHFLDAEPVSEEDLSNILERATGASLYNAAEAMRQGYFCAGALRIGICGRASKSVGGRGFSSFSSLCIRLARENRGVCGSLADRLCENGFQNTLILAPPGGGKTTALRDLVRTLANRKLRIGVIDERGEIAGAGFDLGLCSDVITGLDKLSGALLLLRTMTPQIIAADEISSPEDLLAIEEIYGCGVGILASAHTSGKEELMKRDSYRRLIEKEIFRYFLVIRFQNGKRVYELEALR